MMRSAKAFTLLEVLVAMAIFAIVGLSANQMLRTIMDSHARAQQVTDAFGGMTRAFTTMERDFAQMVPRGVRDEYGEPLPALMVQTGTYAVEFTRTGWNNPALLPRSSLQRVAYGLTADGELVRYVWWVLDRAEDSQPVNQVLLTGVEDFRVNLVDDEGNTTDVWPDLDGNKVLPVGVEVFIDTKSMGEIRQVYALVSMPHTIDRGGPGGGKGRGSEPNDGQEEGSEGGIQL